MSTITIRSAPFGKYNRHAQKDFLKRFSLESLKSHVLAGWEGLQNKIYHMAQIFIFYYEAVALNETSRTPEKGVLAGFHQSGHMRAMPYLQKIAILDFA